MTDLTKEEKRAMVHEVVQKLGLPSWATEEDMNYALENNTSLVDAARIRRERKHERLGETT